MSKAVELEVCTRCGQEYDLKVMAKHYIRRYAWKIRLCPDCNGKCIKCGTPTSGAPICSGCFDEVLRLGREAFPEVVHGTTRGLKKASGSSHGLPVDKVQAYIPNSDCFDDESGP